MAQLIGNDGLVVRQYFCPEDVREVISPFFMTRKQYLKKYQYNWRTRLMMEFKNSRTYFLTLTFDSEHLPQGSLDHQLEIATDCVQKFFKRLRRKVEYHNLGLNFKYYVVSENGEEFGRLHLHALLFADGTNKKVLNHRTAVPLFRLIDETWKLGRTQIRVADERKVYYVTKYIFKRCFDKLYHSWKSNGIGLSYMTDELIRFLRVHVQGFIHLGGRVRWLPKYIRTKIFNADMLATLNEPYLLTLNEKDRGTDKGYYVKDYWGELNPIPNYIGDLINKMFQDNQELSHLIKYGGYLS